MFFVPSRALPLLCFLSAAAPLAATLTAAPVVALPGSGPALVASAFVAPASPKIPAREFSAADLGVLAGQPAPITDTLQQAIDTVASAGGGRLVLPPGDYVSGPLRLVSRLDFHLQKGAVLKLLPREAGYPTDGKRYPSLLAGSDLRDLRLGGEGLIDGRGEPWWVGFRSKTYTLRRPALVYLDGCERVELSGLTFLNPPNTHISMRLCREITLRDLTLEAPDDSPNTDGINISGKNYLIERCRISTGDDNIVILTPSAPDWTTPVCENFWIRDCELGFGHGLSVGSYTSGGIRGLLAERITFDGTTSGIRLKAGRDRGGLVEDLTYRDITMRRVRWPVYLTSHYPKTPAKPSLDSAQPPSPNTPRWQNILIDNIDVTDCAESIILWGLPEQPIGAVTIRQGTFRTRRGARLYHAPQLTLDRVELHPAQGPALDRWPAP